MNPKTAIKIMLWLLAIVILLILLIKGKYLREFIPMKIVNIILWIFLVLFGLNTVGNILAKTNFEKFFALLTLVSAILIWIILKKDKNEHTTVHKQH